MSRSLLPLRRVVLGLSLGIAGSTNAALTTSFSGGVLTVTSDAADAVVVTCGLFIPRAPTDTVAVNGLNVTGSPLCNQVTSVVVNGGPGANTIDLGGMLATDFVALTSTTLNGGADADSITGSFAADTVVGGTGNDTIALGAGNDTSIWNNGDNTDTVADGGGDDRQVVNGAAAGDTMTIASGTAPVEVRFARTNLVPFTVDLTDVETLEVNGLDGDDTISAEGLAAGLITLALNGGSGNDTLTGSSGIDTIDGGEGNDVVDANPGNDLVTLGPGDDTNTWNNGDNTDTVDGGDGADTQVVNGAAAGDVFEIGASGGSARGVQGFLFRRTNLVPFDVAATGVETLAVNGLDGADTVTTEGLPGVVQNLDGGAPAVFPGDTLVVNGFSGNLATTPVVTLPGSGAISHVNFEFAAISAGIPQSIPAIGTWGVLLAILAIGGLALVHQRRD